MNVMNVCFLQVAGIEKAKITSASLTRGYGVATISRLLKIIDLFCRISSLL